MKAFLCIATLFAAATLGAAADPAPTAATDPPPEKPKLAGGFKGQPVTPGVKASPQKPLPPPPAGTRKPAARITIDNSMVKKNSASPGAPKPSGNAPAAAAAPPAAPPPPVELPKVVDLNGHDETFWRARAAQVREAVRKAKSDSAAADAEEKREENDFYAWDDGQYRDNVIKPAWDKAREDAARARQDLAAAQKDLDTLEDDARRSGAFPGWIRE